MLFCKENALQMTHRLIWKDNKMLGLTLNVRVENSC